jgi:hypothetical protein
MTRDYSLADNILLGALRMSKTYCVMHVSLSLYELFSDFEF